MNREANKLQQKTAKISTTAKKQPTKILIILKRDLIKIFIFSSAPQVEAGDVILKVNGTDVHRYSTKEGKLSHHVVCAFPLRFCSAGY